MRRLLDWLHANPGKAGALAGWYQQFASGVVTLYFLKKAEPILGEVPAGLWFSFQALAGVVGLTDFGLGFVFARQVAWSIAAGDGRKASDDFLHLSPGWQGISDLYAACRRALGQMVLVGALLLVVIYHGILPFTKFGEHRSPQLTLTWYLLGASALLMVRTKQFQSIIEGLGKVWQSRVIAGTYQFAAGLVALAAMTLTQNLAVMAAVTLLASVAFYLAARLQARRLSCGQLDLARACPPGLVRALWKVAAPMGIFSTGSWLAGFTQIPLAGALIGPAAVAPFLTAQKIGSMLSAAISQMALPQLPLYTQALARHDYRDASRRMWRSVRIMSALAAICFLGYYFVSPPLALWWREGRPYVDSLTLKIMTADYVIGICSVVWSHFIVASGRNPFTWTTIVAGILNVIFCCLLAPRYGLAAVPGSLLAAAFCTNYILGPLLGIRLLARLRRGEPPFPLSEK